MPSKPTPSLLRRLLGSHLLNLRIRRGRWQRALSPHAERLFFVLGVPRSGTTLLCSKLAGHPGAICLDEPWLHWQRFGKFPLPERAMTALGRGGPWSADLPSDTMARLAQTFERVGLKETFRTDAYWPGLGNLLLVDRLADMVPTGRTLAIIRNPLAVWNSVRNRRMARTGTADKEVSSRFTGNWNALSEWVTHRGIQHLRYEDLVREPEPMFRGLCERLGIPFHPSMLEADAGSKPEKPGHPATRGVFAGSERRFEEELPERDAEFIRRECGPLMQSFGYRD